MLIHYFQDNQSILGVSQLFLIQKERSEMIQKQSSCHNSSCMWPLAVKTEVEDKGKIRSSTGKQIIAEPKRDEQEPPTYDFTKSFSFYKYRAEWNSCIITTALPASLPQQLFPTGPSA